MCANRSRNPLAVAAIQFLVALAAVVLIGTVVYGDAIAETLTRGVAIGASVAIVFALYQQYVARGG